MATHKFAIFESGERIHRKIQLLEFKFFFKFIKKKFNY